MSCSAISAFFGRCSNETAKTVEKTVEKKEGKTETVAHHETSKPKVVADTYVDTTEIAGYVMIVETSVAKVTTLKNGATFSLYK